MLHLKSQYSILKYSLDTKCTYFCHVAWITCLASAENITHSLYFYIFVTLVTGKCQSITKGDTVQYYQRGHCSVLPKGALFSITKGALFTPFLVCLAGLCACFCVKLVDRQTTVVHISPGQDEVTWNSCVHFLIDFHTTDFYMKQTSINVACMGPDRCWVIEYSWLSESTYTDLSSYR